MTIRGQSADGVPPMGATPPAPEDLDARTDEDADDSGLRRLDPVPDEPPANLRYRRAFKLKSGAVDLWRARSIVLSLTVRDLRATYSQEVLGFAWAVLAPITLMVVFTFLFNRGRRQDRHRRGLVPDLPVRRAACRGRSSPAR